MRTSQTRLLGYAALRLAFYVYLADSLAWLRSAPPGVLFALRRLVSLRQAQGFGSPLRPKRPQLVACAAAEPALVRVVAAGLSQSGLLCHVYGMSAARR